MPDSPRKSQKRRLAKIRPHGLALRSRLPPKRARRLCVQRAYQPRNPRDENNEHHNQEHRHRSRARRLFLCGGAVERAGSPYARSKSGRKPRGVMLAALLGPLRLVIRAPFRSISRCPTKASTPKGREPKTGRYSKGESGCPSGRPKGVVAVSRAKNLLDLILTAAEGQGQKIDPTSEEGVASYLERLSSKESRSFADRARSALLTYGRHRFVPTRRGQGQGGVKKVADTSAVSWTSVRLFSYAGRIGTGVSIDTLRLTRRSRKWRSPSPLPAPARSPGRGNSV